MADHESSKMSVASLTHSSQAGSQQHSHAPHTLEEHATPHVHQASSSQAHVHHHHHHLEHLHEPEFHTYTFVEEHEDIETQKVNKDYSGLWGKRVFCKRHYNSMAPIRILFQLGGRFPFSTQLQSDGTHFYHFSWLFPGTIYYIFAIVCMFLGLIIGLSNVASVTLNFTVFHGDRNPILYQEQREYENVLVKRYFIPLIFVYASMIHGCISGILILHRRHYIAHYLTFWSRAVYTMHMDISRKAFGFSMRVLLFFIVVIVAISLLAAFKIGPTAVGLPTIFGDMTFRQFVSEEIWLQKKSQTRKNVQIIGAIFLIFTFTASKSAILFFIYLCKTMQSSFAVWNGRVYAAVLRGGEFAQTEEGRTTYKLLFKDFCVLMDLMEGLDVMSSWTVESYFACQVFSLFFELYFCIRTAKHGDNRLNAAYPPPGGEAYFVRPKDWALGLIMLFVSMSIMFSAAKSAADVAEEAMAGLEVIRRRTLLGRKTDDELYFMLSMYTSYTSYKKIIVTSGGYFYMDKDFLIGLVSSVLSYFIILYQFQPVMDISFPAVDQTDEERIRYGKFLADIEGLEMDHYETTPRTGDVWNLFRFPVNVTTTEVP